MRYNSSKEVVEIVQPALKKLFKTYPEVQFRPEYKVGEAILSIKEISISMKAIEFEYLTELVNTAVKLLEQAPSHYCDKISTFFPQEACMHIIYNKKLPGKLRGSILQIYKCVYVNPLLSRNKLEHIKSNIVLEIGESIEENEELDFKSGKVVKKRKSPKKRRDTRQMSQVEVNYKMKTKNMREMKQAKINEIR